MADLFKNKLNKILTENFNDDGPQNGYYVYRKEADRVIGPYASAAKAIEAVSNGNPSPQVLHQNWILYADDGWYVYTMPGKTSMAHVMKKDLETVKSAAVRYMEFIETKDEADQAKYLKAIMRDTDEVMMEEDEDEDETEDDVDDEEDKKDELFDEDVD